MTMTTMMWIALKATLMLTGACLANLMLRRASASLRHLLWAGALTAVLALPFLEASGLQVTVPVPSRWLGSGEVEGPTSPTETPSATAIAGVAGSGTAGSASRAVGAPPSAAVAPAVPTRRASDVSGIRGTAPPVAAAMAETVAEAVEVDPVLDADPGTAPSPIVARESSLTSLPWMSFVQGGWAAGVLLLLLGTAISHWAAFRTSTSRVKPASPSAQRRLAMLLVELGMKSRVRLVVSRTLWVPATWGLRQHTIVLPRSSEHWSAARLDRVLLHELAHVRRGDCATQLIGELARALHWPIPLAWVALRRLRVESERAADDEVLARGDVPSAYAGDLVALARGLRASSDIPGAALAMARETGLGGRVVSILDPRRARRRVGRAAVAVAGLGALGLAFSATGIVPVALAQEAPDVPPAPPRALGPVALSIGMGGDLVSPPDAAAALAALTPAATPQAQEHCIFRGDGRRSTSYHTDDDVTRIRWETDGCRVDIDIEGRIEWTDDDTGVRAMADGALFEIEERVGRSRQRARLERDGGRIERRYWVDGDSEPWSSAADAWLAGILPQIFRHTTINAEARLERMLREGGPERVFSEVELIASDHVVRTYLELLMAKADLDTAHYARIIDLAGTLDSDHSSGELLLSVVGTAGLQPAFQGPMLRAAANIESDHQKTRVLMALLESDLSADQFDEVIRTAQSVESDHSLGLILMAVAEGGGLTAASRAAYMETFAGIESDHQLTMVIGAFLDAGELSTAELTQVLDMTNEIESDHSQGQVLMRVAEEYPLTGGQVDAYLRAATRIGSDHQLGTVASVILRRNDLTDSQLGVVFSLAEQIGSDHQRAMVLNQVLEERELSRAQQDRLLEVAAGIDSDHQLATTLTVLIDRAELGQAGVLGVLRLAARVGSDHQTAQVLTNLAEAHAIDGEALRLYHEIADGLSDHQRDQVLAMIARR